MTVRKMPYHINLGEIASKRKRKKNFFLRVQYHPSLPILISKWSTGKERNIPSYTERYVLILKK